MKMEIQVIQTEPNQSSNKRRIKIKCMKTQKLSLNDFEAVGTAELFSIKGGIMDVGPSSFRNGTGETNQRGGGGGGCAGDPNGFGGTFDADEVVVTTNGPCVACDSADAYPDEQTFYAAATKLAHYFGFHNNPGGSAGDSPC